MKLTYYTDAHVTLHHGDALDVLRALPTSVAGWSTATSTLTTFSPALTAEPCCSVLMGPATT